MPPIPTPHMEDVRFFEGAKNFYTTHRNLGRLYRERGQWEKAIASFEEALSYVPSYFDRQYAADIKVSLGSAYEKTGKLEEAFRVLSDVLPIADRPYYVNNLLGVISTKMNDLEKAERYFKQAVKSKENYAPAHYNLGILYMKLNIQQKGEDELRRAAQLNPKYKKFLTHNAFPPSDVQNIDE
jgi:tetratricopeptide (TPR) repeat protein